jgi:hypothetical protein
MHKNMRAKSGLAVVAVAAVCGSGWWGVNPVSASDHDEAPLVKMDPAADITDLYVFNSGDNKTTIIVCWAGFHDLQPDPGNPAVYDSDVLYTIHVDNNGDNEADLQFRWRFGVNATDQFGVKWDDIPGSDGPVIGFVDQVYPAGNFARVWAGHADDPFFFDAGGYLATLQSGAIEMTKDNDFLAGRNVTAAAIEIDTDLISGGGAFQVWATAAKKG